MLSALAVATSARNFIIGRMENGAIRSNHDLRAVTSWFGVVADGGEVSVLLGNGDGSFQAPLSFGAGKYPNFVAAGDFNLDGALDLAAANSSSNNVSVLINNTRR